METEILATDSASAMTVTRVLVPSAVAAANRTARRSAGMLAVVDHATDLAHAAMVAHVEAHGRTSAGPALAMFGALPTEAEIDGWADAIVPSNVVGL